MVVLEIPDMYGNVLLVGVLIVFQCQMFAYFCVAPVRMKVFSEKFLKDNFGEEHQKQFKCDPAMGGFPDVGSGRYSEKLPYKDWFNFNSAQRTHHNYLEQLTTIVTLFLVGGLKHAVCSYYVGLLYILARFIYVFSYFSSPNKRFPAVAVISICLFTQSLLALHASLIIANYNLILSV